MQRAKSATKRLDDAFRDLKLKEKFFLEGTEANGKKLDLLRLKIHNKRRDIKQYRGKMGGCLAYRENEKALRKTRNIIEDRIVFTNQKLMEREAENCRLKAAIDDIRREILVAKSVDARLNNERETHCNAIYELDERFDAFEDELEDLEEQERAVQAAIEKERKKLRSRYLFLEKQCELDSIENCKKKTKRKAVKRPMAVDSGRLPSMVSATTQTKWKVAFNSVLKLNSEKTINDYKEAFEKIKVASGVQNLKEFVSRFKNIEQDNYKKFALVSDLQTQHEILSQELAEEKETLSRLQHKAKTVDNQRKSILNGVQEQLSSLNLKREAARDRVALLNEEMKDLQQGVKRILALVLPTEAPAPKSTPSSSPLVHPLMTYLGMIEQKVIELAAESCKPKKGDNKESKANAGCSVGPQVPAMEFRKYEVQPPVLRIDPQPFQTEYDLSPGEEHPLSYKELKEQVTQELCQTKKKPGK